MKLISKALLIAGAAGSLALATVPSHAQNACFEREDALARLQSQYGENVAARGLTAEGKAMFELLTSEDGTWTILVTRTDGQSCVVAGGDAWTNVERIKGQTGA